ncbi:MAG: hypothetical protein EOL98_04620 [Negativicutes bacterium]|nr:hypothetical protein [Negativicutes bacterium]
MMKKVLSVLLVFSLFFLVNITNVLAADVAQIKSPKLKTCVVLIGNSDVKTPDFIKYINEQFNNEEAKNKVVCGPEIQSVYQNYWFQKGFIEEQKLQKQDLHDFVKFSSYDRCLFLLISEPIVEKTKVPAGWFTTAEKTRASIEVKCFLADGTDIIKSFSVAKNDDSMASDLRAKRGAFEKCVKEFAKEFQLLI